jgi:hypothetical protein
MKTAPASLSILLALLPVSQVKAQTTSITIGQFKYVGTVKDQSAYELHLHNKNVTKRPIHFSNVVLYVKGTSAGSGPITTGLGCGLPPYKTPCDLLFIGQVGTQLDSCGTSDGTLDCVSLDMQFVSPSRKNFSFELVDGSQFCANGVNNIYILLKPNHLVLDPKCDSDGFCKGVTVPVVLNAAPAGSCSQ